ncbi:MAG: ABC transporter ATP-binding protein [Paludibacteraceae bacterium]|nr:ABC transporter ATP-binding protein [Paludibacteraceae bacterium]
MSAAIEFNNVSKQYRLGLVSTGTLSHDLQRFWAVNIRGKEDPYLKIGEENDRATKGNSEYVWALRDIDFKVEQGDVVGIIGKNGAGKSTLLKLLSKVTAPTLGTICARGRIASLLEVGTGFHPEMTGRENIYLNGAIMGMTKSEIKRKLDEIVDFSGCERYLDTPVKRYSSGMTVRLGFAVAAHLDPEILVVDEVLAVGDAEFQKKAIGKMQDISQGTGRTVLFVSHNMASIGTLCKSCVILENGRVKFIGETEPAIELYRQSNAVDLDRVFDFDSEERRKMRVRFSDFFITDEHGMVKDAYFFEDKLKFTFKVKSEDAMSVAMRIAVFDVNEVRVMAFDSADVGSFLKIERGETTIEVNMLDQLNIKPGIYKVNISLRQGTTVMDHIVGVATFDIAERDFFGSGRFSAYDMAISLKHHQWTIK